MTVVVCGLMALAGATIAAAMFAAIDREEAWRIKMVGYGFLALLAAFLGGSAWEWGRNWPAIQAYAAAQDALPHAPHPRPVARQGDR